MIASGTPAEKGGIHKPSIRYKSAHRRKQVRSLSRQAILEMNDWLQVMKCTASHSAVATLRREPIKISHLLINIHRKPMNRRRWAEKVREGKHQVGSFLQASEWEAMQKTDGMEQCRPTNREMDYTIEVGWGQNEWMEQLMRLLQRLKGKKTKPLLHTPEELECFKRDAIENRAKHYW